jgi:hypothetical protein
VADLPDNEQVRESVEKIKDIQQRLDRGAVGSGAYYMKISLWTRVRGLNQILDSGSSKILDLLDAPVED